MNAKTNNNQKVRTSGKMRFISAHCGAGSTFNDFCYSLPWGVHAEVSVQNTAPLSPWQHPRSRSMLRFPVNCSPCWLKISGQFKPSLGLSSYTPLPLLPAVRSSAPGQSKGNESRWRGRQSKPKCPCVVWALLLLHTQYRGQPWQTLVCN